MQACPHDDQWIPSGPAALRTLPLSVLTYVMHHAWHYPLAVTQPNHSALNEIGVNPCSHLALTQHKPLIMCYVLTVAALC